MHVLFCLHQLFVNCAHKYILCIHKDLDPFLSEHAFPNMVAGRLSQLISVINVGQLLADFLSQLTDRRDTCVVLFLCVIFQRFSLPINAARLHFCLILMLEPVAVPLAHSCWSCTAYNACKLSRKSISLMCMHIFTACK